MTVQVITPAGQERPASPCPTTPVRVRASGRALASQDASGAVAPSCGPRPQAAAARQRAWPASSGDVPPHTAPPARPALKGQGVSPPRHGAHGFVRLDVTCSNAPPSGSETCPWRAPAPGTGAIRGVAGTPRAGASEEVQGVRGASVKAEGVGVDRARGPSRRPLVSLPWYPPAETSCEGPSARAGQPSPIPQPDATAGFRRPVPPCGSDVRWGIGGVKPEATTE